MSTYDDKEEAYFGTPRREMLQFLPPDAVTFLEIGCGTGAFGAVVKRQRDCHYVGVELFPEAARQARDRLDEVHVLDISSTDLPFMQRSFDCLVCNDVLEHLTDPWAVLKKLTRHIKPGGHIVVSLPNVRFSEVVKDLVFRKQWTYREQGVLDRTHLRFFTESSMRSLIESTGARVIRLHGINGIKYAWRLQLLNVVLLGFLSDMRFMQYGCLAQVAD